jgi:hypothetical protein
MQQRQRQRPLRLCGCRCGITGLSANSAPSSTPPAAPLHPPQPLQVANVGPADWNFDETLSTLRYAGRAKHITNKPRVNEDPKDAMLREFQLEISRLRQALQVRAGGVVGARWGCEPWDGAKLAAYLQDCWRCRSAADRQIMRLAGWLAGCAEVVGGGGLSRLRVPAAGRRGRGRWRQPGAGGRCRGRRGGGGARGAGAQAAAAGGGGAAEGGHGAAAEAGAAGGWAPGGGAEVRLKLLDNCNESGAVHV